MGMLLVFFCLQKQSCWTARILILKSLIWEIVVIFAKWPCRVPLYNGEAILVGSLGIAEQFDVWYLYIRNWVSELWKMAGPQGLGNLRKSDSQLLFCHHLTLPRRRFQICFPAKIIKPFIVSHPRYMPGHSVHSLHFTTLNLWNRSSSKY
jgi:hypothetical protein